MRRAALGRRTPETGAPEDKSTWPDLYTPNLQFVKCGWPLKASGILVRSSSTNHTATKVLWLRREPLARRRVGVIEDIGDLGAFITTIGFGSKAAFSLELDCWRAAFEGLRLRRTGVAP